MSYISFTSTRNNKYFCASSATALEAGTSKTKNYQKCLTTSDFFMSNMLIRRNASTRDEIHKSLLNSLARLLTFWRATSSSGFVFLTCAVRIDSKNLFNKKQKRLVRHNVGEKNTILKIKLSFITLKLYFCGNTNYLIFILKNVIATLVLKCM